MDNWLNDSNATFYIPNISEDKDSSESNIENNYQERYHNRIDGPWVVGICECVVDEMGQRKTKEVRYFHVLKRDSNTLISLIKNEVEIGETIFTDEWAAYRQLSQNGYIHRTVNHSKNYVSDDGSHTNSIEVCWHHLKTEIIRKMRGIPISCLDSYLTEMSLRSKYKKKIDFLYNIIENISKYYSIE